jgi:hypothetical protein
MTMPSLRLILLFLDRGDAHVHHVILCCEVPLTLATYGRIAKQSFVFWVGNTVVDHMIKSGNVAFTLTTRLESLDASWHQWPLASWNEMVFAIDVPAPFTPGAHRFDAFIPNICKTFIEHMIYTLNMSLSLATRTERLDTLHGSLHILLLVHNKIPITVTHRYVFWPKGKITPLVSLGLLSAR